MHNKCCLVWCTHHWWSRHLLQSGDVEALPICTVFSSVPSNIDFLIFSGSGAIELPLWEKMWPFGKHWELWSQISSYRYLRNEFEWYDINMSINQLVAFFVLKNWYPFLLKMKHFAKFRRLVRETSMKQSVRPGKALGPGRSSLGLKGAMSWRGQQISWGWGVQQHSSYWMFYCAI